MRLRPQGAARGRLLEGLHTGGPISGVETNVYTGWLAVPSARLPPPKPRGCVRNQMEYFLTTGSAALATGWNPHLLRDAALEKFGPRSIGRGGYENFDFAA